MKRALIHAALIGTAMALHVAPVLADSSRGAAEVINTVDDFNVKDGSIVVGGRRYPLDGAVEVVNRNGEPVAPDALRRGASVGILEENGRVTKLVIFDN